MKNLKFKKRNPIAKELLESGKYFMRKVPNKKKQEKRNDWKKLDWSDVSVYN